MYTNCHLSRYSILAVCLLLLFLCSRVIVRDVQMVSRSRLQPSDHALDLAHLFERRRAIIDSAIMRFLKKEKEMSLDNIANKVSYNKQLSATYRIDNIIVLNINL